MEQPAAPSVFETRRGNWRLAGLASRIRPTVCAGGSLARQSDHHRMMASSHVPRWLATVFHRCCEALQFSNHFAGPRPSCRVLVEHQSDVPGDLDGNALVVKYAQVRHLVEMES